mmetsp:Transcript_9416/g.14565  ORF Transcript_9416/g.14565 Transcript_9416/m.14565 type:complete len:97 (-) Transcript_9416:397-687(-)
MTLKYGWPIQYVSLRKFSLTKHANIFMNWSPRMKWILASFFHGFRSEPTNHISYIELSSTLQVIVCSFLHFLLKVFLAFETIIEQEQLQLEETESE